MPGSGSAPGNSSRRTRRAAQRQQLRSVTPATVRRQRSTQSPLLLMTVAAIVVGLGVIVFLANQAPGSSVPTAIATPAVTTAPALAHDRSLGDPAAPQTLDVWSDFQCPFCQQFWTGVEPTLVSDFIATGRVRLVNHDFVFIGPDSMAAAIAARCADAQGQFWPFHDYLFANQVRENSGEFSAARLTEIASAVGLNLATWQSCLADPGISTAVQQETAAGKAAGVTGTPTLFLNGQKLAAFDFNTVSAAIMTSSAVPGVSPSSRVAGSSPSATAGSTP